MSNPLPRGVRRVFGRCVLLAVAGAPFSLMFGAGASARSNGISSLPSPNAAQVIVTGLWNRRELALTRLDTASVPAIETGDARQQDVAYINAVRCRCERMKNEHPVTGVIPQVPKSSVQPVFFAQVHTTEVESGDHVWYLVAVERTGGGVWKLAFINVAGDTPTPPLQTLTSSNGFTSQVTDQTRARMTRLTENAIHHAMSHNKLVLHTDYGATVHRRAVVMPGVDGVFGLALPSGQVLTCFTLHTLDTFSMPPGSFLQQGPTQSQWGHQLAPGSYKTITSDVASPRCVVGKGVDATAGDLWSFYYDRTVAMTGVPALP